jgi:hypothetical protein
MDQGEATMQTDLPPTPPAWPRRRRATSFVFPLILVVVGVVLLLNNLGVLPWSVWVALGQLWPVLLILFGVDLLLGRRSSWLGAIVALIMLLAVLGVAIWMSLSGFRASTSANPATVRTATVPVAGATSGQINLRFGAGILTVGSLPAQGTDLAEATATLPPGWQLTQRVEHHGDVADVTLGVDGNGPFLPFGTANRNTTMKLNAVLAQQVPLTINADVGAGQSDFDLTNLAVSNFTLNDGAGQATVRLPNAAGQTSVDIRSGAGQLILVVPPGVGAYVHNGGGLVNLRVPSDRFQKVGDGYQTTDYQSAQNRVDVNLQVGIGEVDVR